jgi:hypothetical protein
MWPLISLRDLTNLLVISMIQRFPSLAELPYLWELMKPATCMPDGCFCEPVVHGIIRQPVNTWSNLAFILAGTLTMIVAMGDLANPSTKRDHTNLMRSKWIYPGMYAYAAALIGLGSMLYHASMIFYAQVADILGMYLLSTFMVLYNLSRAFKLKGWGFFGSFVGINIALGIISTAWPLSRRPIFIGLLVLILLSESLARKMAPAHLSMKMLLAASAGLAVACLSWLLDTSGVFCSPDSWLQLHSLWHIGMAGAIWFLYLYYRSERPALEKMGSNLPR